MDLQYCFLSFLYHCPEIWKKEPQDDYEDEDPEPGYVKSKKELKKEEKARERRYKEEERQIKQEDKQRKKEKKAKRKKIKTGGFVDEIYEDELEPEVNERPVTVQTATSEAHELLKKEIAAATADEPEEKPVPVQGQKVSSDTAMIVPKVKETLRAMMEEDKRKETSPEEDEEILIKRMAVPVWSAAQIADAAKNQGDAPEIIKDDVTKVTLFDYSDIIAEEKKLPTEE